MTATTGNPRRQKATSNARLDLLTIVRETRPWGGTKLKGKLSELASAHGWEAATPTVIEAVVSTFQDCLRLEPDAGIQDQLLDDETARDVLWGMLRNAMAGRDPLKNDYLADAVTGHRIPKRTLQRWRAETDDGGFSNFLVRHQRRAGRAYLEERLGLTPTAARAWLRAHPDENPATVRPAKVPLGDGQP